MKSKKTFLIAIVLISIAFVSCKTRSIRVQLLVPAQISIPQHIQTIGLLNHSLADKDQKWNNILEGFITGESIFADKQASYSALRGCSNKLNQSPRLKSVVLENENYKGTGTKQFPLPLEWYEVDNLCKKYGVDAIAALETFDSDINTNSGKNVKNETKDGKNITVTEYWADLQIRSNAGWRIYDNKNKKIIDENVFTDQKGWYGVGVNPSDAKGKLPSKRGAVDEAGYFSGEMFAVRISPNWVWATRTYYSKENDDFKYAVKLVQLKDWKGAAEIWKKYTNWGNQKIAGRACHNMAVAAEMEGELKVALDWATKAYRDFNIKSDLNYINLLNTRIIEQDRLKQQMEG